MIRPRLFSILFGMLFCFPLSAYADDTAEGEKLYQKGKLDAASAYFERAIDTNGYNATAHYYLGHCLMGQKNYVRAATEYQRAMDFTDDHKMEDYCRTVLEKLKPYTEAKPAATGAAGAAASKHPDSHTSDASTAERVSRVKSIMERSSSQAKEIMARADERCKPIEEEKKAVLQTMSIKLRRRVETTSSDERDEATHDYDRQISSIKDLAKHQADGVLEQGRRDAAAVGQGLPNLDELLQGK